MSEEFDRLDELLDGAALWGLELEPRFRVLAATFEPTAERWPWDPTDDRRIQILLFPVSVILALLRHHGPDGVELRTFEVDHLLDVVAAFGGAAVEAPLFGRPEPKPGEWGPKWSLEGRSGAPDGRRHTFTAALETTDLDLKLFARFDDIEVKDSAGGDLAWGSRG